MSNNTRFNTSTKDGLYFSKGWQQLADICNGKQFNLRLRFHLNMAMYICLNRIKKELQKNMKSMVFPDNHPIKSVLSNDEQSLIVSGWLFNAIKTKIVNETADEITGGVGFFFSDTNSKGINAGLLAQKLIDGWQIEVTDDMRKLFAANGYPLKDDTKYLSVPPRDFFSPILNNEVLINSIANIFEKAVIKAFLNEQVR